MVERVGSTNSAESDCDPGHGLVQNSADALRVRLCFGTIIF